MRSAIPKPQRIVIRGLNWLGDAVMSTPALQRLREAFPEAHIALLTPAKLNDLWHRHPDLSETIPFSPSQGVFTIARRIQAGKFDTAIVFPNSPRSALEMFFARVPRRIGVTRPWRNFFLTDVIASRPGELPMRRKSRGEVRRLIRQAPAGKREIFPQSAHHTLHYLHIVAFLGANPASVAPRLVVTEQELTDVRHKFCESDGSRPIVGYSAGAEYGPAKRWPTDRFIEAARRIHRKTSCITWVFGGTTEQPAAGQIVDELGKSRIPARSLAGETTLRELCAALRACDLLVTNDTGPMHVAAAVGTPVVAPFGSTSPELTGPGGTSQQFLLSGKAPCAPCFRRDCPIDLRCLHDVTVEQVVSAALQLLSAGVR